jgi:carboxymethylenebutenolidase
MSAARIARRAFIAGCAGLLALAAGGCATLPAGGDAAAMRSVAIETADGSADALLFTPLGEGPWPAVLLFADVSGLRPAYADIGRRLADEGYVVLAPNAFYRSVKLDGSAATAAPVLEASETFARGQEWRAAATDEAVIADTRAYVAYLDALPQVDAGAKAGALGYDIGGAHAMIAARAAPDRIAAVATAHPLAIATARETSPHLFLDQSRASYLIEIAAPDDEREPGDKDDLRAAFASAGLPASIKVVPAAHGYAVSDQAGYDAGAEASFWRAMLALFETRLQ